MQDLPFASNDFETPLIRPALQSPPPVCYSEAYTTDTGEIYATADQDAAFRRNIEAAADGKIVLVGHNFAYDAAVALAWIDDVAEPLFAAYEKGNVIDTMIFERVAEIGKFTPRKNLGLDVVGAAYGIELTKDPEIRLGYGRLYGAPLSAYSPGQRQYPIDDAENTLRLIERQLKRHGHVVNLDDVAMLCRKQFWLQLTRNWGMRTDPGRLDVLRSETLKHVEELRALATKTTIDLPLLKASKKLGKAAGDMHTFPLLRDDGTKDMRAIKAYVLRAYDGMPPITDTGEKKIKDEDWTEEQAVAAGYISTNAVTLSESGDFMLEKFAEFGEWNAVLNKDLPMLTRGSIYPIHTRFGIADTTRSTSANPNMQNFRKKAGIRECIVPRAGWAFVAVDHGGLELATFAQVLVWLGIGRQMADKINADMCLHCDVAKEIVGVSYEQAYQWHKTGLKSFKPNRQVSKVVNFGRPGFMGAETLVFYAKHSYHVDFAEVAANLGMWVDEEPEARALKFARMLITFWERANPEGPEYLQYVKRLPEAAGGKLVTIPGTTIVRRGATVAAAANTGFQGLGAVTEAHVGWQITRAIHLGIGALGKSGARIVNFVHDEFILEVPLAWVTAVAAQLEQIMADAPRKYLPDVKLKAEAVAMMRWSKDAETIVIKGELVPWFEGCTLKGDGSRMAA